jgi:arabinofuranosyltransferase
LPLATWEVFSLFYYGAPVPNTALAKAAMGLGLAARAAQAWTYLARSFCHDPISPGILMVGMVLGWSSGDRFLRRLALGIGAQLVYLVVIGGDYMGGRFLGTPVYVGIVLIVLGLRSPSNQRGFIVAVPVSLVGLGVIAKMFALLSPPGDVAIDQDGMADERAFYYPDLGLLPVVQKATWRGHPWFQAGLFMKEQPGFYLLGPVGMAGYAAGPSVHLLEPFALADPFLARLPARDAARPGHYERALPPGYLDSELTGRDQLHAPALSRLYQDVNLATRAALWAPGRLSAIFRLLIPTSHRDALFAFDRNAIGLPGIPPDSRGMLSCFGLSYGGPTIFKPETDGQGKVTVKISAKFPAH